MATWIDRIPDDKHLRLKELAESQGVSVNKLIAKGASEAIEELSTVAFVEFDPFPIEVDGSVGRCC